MLSFPELSREPALNTNQTTLDPTIRDEYENGMEATRARYTRVRREWEISIEYLPPEDVAKLQTFVEKEAVYGANIFLFPDLRDPTNPQYYRVRFSSLPKFTDAGWAEDSLRQTAKFTIREV